MAFPASDTGLSSQHSRRGKASSARSAEPAAARAASCAIEVGHPATGWKKLAEARRRNADSGQERREVGGMALAQADAGSKKAGCPVWPFPGFAKISTRFHDVLHFAAWDA